MLHTLNGTADESEMRRRGKHVPIVCPDFSKPGIGGSNQMECVESPQIACGRKRTSRRLDPAQETLRDRYRRDNSAIHIVQKQVAPYRGVGRSDGSLANLAMRLASHPGNADCGRIQTVRLPRQFPDQPSIGLIPVALAEAGHYLPDNFAGLSPPDSPDT